MSEAKAANGIRKVAFTMLPITDATRARAFYEETLGLTAGLVGGNDKIHWIEFDLPGGGCLALSNASGKPGADGATVALEVEDLHGLIARLKTAGVAFKAEGIRGPHCEMAVCIDSEGNALLLHQLDR